MEAGGRFQFKQCDSLRLLLYSQQNAVLFCAAHVQAREELTATVTVKLRTPPSTTAFNGLSTYGALYSLMRTEAIRLYRQFVFVISADEIRTFSLCQTITVFDVTQYLCRIVSERDCSRLSDRYVLTAPNREEQNALCACAQTSVTPLTLSSETGSRRADFRFRTLPVALN
jgi:hypothetical protein